MSESADAISLTEAGHILKKHPATIRRWIRQGCPAVRLGKTGREGSLVSVVDIQRWRAGVIGGNEDGTYHVFAVALLDTQRHDALSMQALNKCKIL